MSSQQEEDSVYSKQKFPASELKREMLLTAVSYLTVFFSFSTVLVPAGTLLLGHDLSYFNLNFLASNPVFIVAIIMAISGIICAKMVKESLSAILNILSAIFNGFLIWVYAMEGILSSVFGFFLFCSVAGLIFIIASIATLKKIPELKRIWANKSRSLNETVRLWAHGALLTIVLLGLAIFALLLTEI